MRQNGGNGGAEVCAGAEVGEGGAGEVDEFGVGVLIHGFSVADREGPAWPWWLGGSFVRVCGQSRSIIRYTTKLRLS